MKIKIIGELVLIVIGILLILLAGPMFTVICVQAPCPPLPGYGITIVIGCILIAIGFIGMLWDYRKSRQSGNQ